MLVNTLSKKSELLAPAGNFMCAYYAFEAGADAVYAGLEKFSARKRANNLVFTELLKLKELAVKKNRKVYITLNTVIKEEEIDELVRILFTLETIEIDGVLVQDFGLLHLIKHYFPRLAVHASTQAVVHDEAGIRQMETLGVKRIVLPRELTLDEISSLIVRFPGMEFEVFIHGALCYSFSGLCLASGILFNRSGNRGECSQVCRSLFSFAGKEAHYLACKDLFTGRHIAGLVSAGIHSLKIEGRLKPPEYVYHVVKYYRFLLDHPEDADTPEYGKLYDNARIVFSRENTPGRLSGGLNENVIISRYTRHSGKPVGRVIAKSDSGFTFTTDTGLRAYDVVSVYLNAAESAPYKIPLRTFIVSGIKTDMAAPGSIISVESEGIPEPGQIVYKLYAKELELPGIGHNCLDEYGKVIPCTVVLKQEKDITLEFAFSLFGKEHVLSWPVVLKPADSPEDITVCFQKVFGRNEGKLFRPGITLLKNETDMPGNSFTVPEKLLLRISGFIHEYIDIEQKKHLKNLMNGVVAQKDESDPDIGRNLEIFRNIRDFVSKRGNLNPENSRTTFFSGACTSIEPLPHTDDAIFVPLNPLLSGNAGALTDAVIGIIQSAGKRRVFLGLNNISHLALIETCRQYENVFFFADYFFYLANSFAVDALSRLSGRIIFGYSWIEGDEKNHVLVCGKSGLPLVKIDDGFSPALFVRAGDFYKESVEEKGIVISDVPADWLFFGTEKFRIEVEQGISYFFRI